MKTNQILATIVGSLAALTISGSAVAQSTSLTQLYPALAGVELQPAQQTSLERISQQTLAQVRQLLAPEQAQKFDLATGQGKSIGNALNTLGLSPEQKRSIKQKLQSNRSQVKGILTPEQQQQVAKNAASLRQQMGGSK